MSRSNVSINAFNRGVVSDLSLARVDIERMALSAEEQTNWMPRTLGPMMLRPGLQYLTSSYNNAAAVYIPFVFSATDAALIECTDDNVRIIIDDEPISRAAGFLTLDNENFDTDLADWTDADDAGGTSAWATGGYMSLTGSGATAARRRQTFGTSGTPVYTEHGITIVVERGIVDVKIGITDGDDSVLSATGLGEGTHRLVFTPTPFVNRIEISSYTKYASLVSSVSMDAAGVVVIPSPWGSSDLSRIRYEQSADVIYVACKDVAPYKIERRSTNSWSIVKYLPQDGPFRLINPTGVTLTPSGLSGDITVTSSAAFFSANNVGGLFSLESAGQKVESSLSADDTFSNEIRVTGIGAARLFSITISGTWSGTITLQRSISEPGAWTDAMSWTGNVSTTGDDALDNQIIYYRIGFKASSHTSGTADVTLDYASGSITGVFRVEGYNSTTSVDAVVLRDLGGTTGTSYWSEGAWSPKRGYPTAVALYEGRLWWAGKGSVYASISDGYESFDSEEEGDSGPINRTIGYGPVDNINWLAPVARLVIGTDGSEVGARSTSFEEPLTPSNFNLKNISTQGSAAVQSVVIDKDVFFVQRNGTRVYKLSYEADQYDYAPNEMTVLSPEVGEPSITRIAVQRQPDTRMHCVRADGKVAVLVFDRAESVICWVLIETDGYVEDAIVLPGTTEDSVYYLVRRTIDGNTVRYLEKWALESECQGGDLNKQADSFIVYDSTATTSITGLDHLEGESVVVWADGLAAGTFTVSGGAITLSTAASKVVVGLPYTARYKSSKLAYGAQGGTALAQKKRVTSLAFMLKNTHIQGLKFGPDFDHLTSLPRVEGGQTLSANYIHDRYDYEASEFNGTYDTDSRICLQATAPRPATVLAVVFSLDLSEKIT